MKHLLRRYVFGPIGHILWPRECPMCHRTLLLGMDGICDDCLPKLPRTEQAEHRENRLELHFFTQKKCIRGAAYCFYPEGHPYRQAIHAFKYKNQPEIGYILGRQAATEWLRTGFFDGVDLLLPIPLHTKRLRERGYNQAEEIARGISEVTGIPIDTRHLVRTINNERQSRKTLSERMQLDDIFSILHPEDLRGKHVLLVDDVVTSGSTMRMAMAHLQSIRGCHYSVFSLAIGNT